jgi:ribosomal protein RSM22 (predicted rRNA methylase)
MSTILRSYDWSVVSRNNKRARSRSYPWDEWFDGRIHQLEPKVDFDGPATSLERVIRTSANRRGVRVRIRIDDGNVVVQQHDGEEPLRTVTKSPSAKSIRERRAATNGDAPATATKTVKRSRKPADAPPKTARRRRIVKADA